MFLIGILKYCPKRNYICALAWKGYIKPIRGCNRVMYQVYKATFGNSPPAVVLDQGYSAKTPKEHGSSPHMGPSTQMWRCSRSRILSDLMCFETFSHTWKIVVVPRGTSPLPWRSVLLLCLHLPVCLQQRPYVYNPNHWPLLWTANVESSHGHHIPQ